ncbi:MAG: putative metal-binding motif-containing protein, partial [Myxococcota bacterium]
MTPVSTPSRTARAVVALALFAPLGTAGCGGADDKVDYILSREALDFGTVAWSDPVTPSATLSVLNPNNDELRVSVLEVRGDGADAVEIGDVEDFTLVSSEGSLSFEVSLAADRTLWDDGEFKVELVLQIGKLVDVSSDWNDPADWRATEATVPVYFTIGCDLDGDLAEDATCGGDDCDDENPSAVLGGNEVCDDADNDCDGYTDEEAADAATWYGDGDGDGYGVDGVVTAACDAPPGFVADGGDCDDFTTTRSPVAEETCNDLDDDCDGETDEDATDAPLWHADLDGDGFGDPASATAACEAPAGWVADGTDCDDLDGLVSPGAAETCNAADDDCDGETDEDAVDVPTWYADADADGFGDAVTSTLACEQPPGWVADPTDCDDTDASVGSGTVYYADGDGDGFGDPAIPAANCAQPDGYVADARDCDDTTGSISPDDAEICDGLDNDCDGSTDTGAGDATAWFADADLDGFGDAATSTDACDAPAGFVADDTDCDDADALAYPSAPELCDGLDNDCDAAIDDDTVTVTWYADADGDTYGDPATTTDSCAVVSGYVLDAADCDDADAAVSPAGTETCNGLDDDCDGVADDDAADALAWYADADGDGFGDAATTALGCDAPSGHVADATDCDDADASVGGLATWFADADGDTFGDAATTAEACAAPGGYVADDTDCDDADALAYPAAPELCDGLDNDCDAAIDDDTVSVTWYADADGDGLGDAASTTDACSQPSGHVADDTDCDDADAGVGGPSTWYADADGDGFGDAANTTDACAQPSGYVGDATDCDDADGSVTTGATWYADGDGDGFGDAATPTDACSAPGGHVADDTDCDDADLLSYPGATEVCDGLDNDCDAAIDDGAVDLVTWHADGDGDGYGDAAVTTDACSQPSGFVADDTDCDDADGGVGGPSTWYADADTDGFGDAASPTDACTQPGGYVADATDCDDADGSVTTGATWYADADADGLGDAASTTTACAAPGGYVADATD